LKVLSLCKDIFHYFQKENIKKLKKQENEKIPGSMSYFILSTHHGWTLEAYDSLVLAKQALAIQRFY